MIGRFLRTKFHSVISITPTFLTWWYERVSDRNGQTMKTLLNYRMRFGSWRRNAGRRTPNTDRLRVPCAIACHIYLKQLPLLDRYPSHHARFSCHDQYICAGRIPDTYVDEQILQLTVRAVSSTRSRLSVAQDIAYAAQ